LFSVANGINKSVDKKKKKKKEEEERRRKREGYLCNFQFFSFFSTYNCSCRRRRTKKTKKKKTAEAAEAAAVGAAMARALRHVVGTYLRSNSAPASLNQIRRSNSSAVAVGAHTLKWMQVWGFAFFLVHSHHAAHTYRHTHARICIRRYSFEMSYIFLLHMYT
jgi:hypothetical protein